MTEKEEEEERGETGGGRLTREERPQIHILTKQPKGCGGRKWEEDKERSRACLVVSTSSSLLLPSEKRKRDSQDHAPQPGRARPNDAETQKGKPKVRASVKKAVTQASQQ